MTEVVKLTFAGTSRVLNGETGSTFIVDHWTEVAGLRTAHVRDYRFSHRDNTYQVWSLAPKHYELLREKVDA